MFKLYRLIFYRSDLTVGNILRHCSVETSGIQDKVYDEERIAKLRNISGMPDHVRNRMKHIHKPPVPKKERDFKLEVMRETYGTYGTRSGISPIVCFPSQQELAEKMEFEAQFDRPLQDMLDEIAQQKREHEESLRKREKMVDKGLKDMPKYIEEFVERHREKEIELQQLEAKKQALLDDSKEMFGYELEHNDPRFEAMLAKRAEAEKKLRRQQRKQEEESEVMGALQAALNDAKAAKAAEQEAQTQEKLRIKAEKAAKRAAR